MEAHIVEWLNLAVRWFHVTAGIAWIGASFYFNWLENSIERINQRSGIAGSLWAVHGGGFYYLEKYQVAPEKLPPVLHWFKWEAYFTWISGFCLLAVVYYFNASTYLIDTQVLDISPSAGILISLAAIVLGWFVYDGLCRSPLIQHPLLFALIGFSLMVAASYLLTQIFSARAAFIHVGAMLATMMAANVFHVIIPSQRALVEAAEKGGELDPSLGKKALQRSLHNNYLTLPVLFIMLSPHFPSTYSYPYNWAVLSGIALVGAGVRHWFNLRGRGEKNAWILPVTAVLFVSLAWVTSPPPAGPAGGPAVSFAEARGIINSRCVSCHSEQPTDDLFKVAPVGIKFDTAEQIKNQVARIHARAVQQKTMPFANKSGMTDEQRATLGRWIEQGAPID